MLISNELIFKKHNVDCIVFKAKHWHHEFSKELINMFEKLKTKYRLEFFSDNNLNTSIEYYLKSSNIKLVMGNLSSALFFAKKINPSIATYSFDEWFVNYTMKKFNNTWEDIPQMRLWYYDLYEPFFQEINPLSLSFALNIDTK